MLRTIIPKSLHGQVSLFSPKWKVIQSLSHIQTLSLSTTTASLISHILLALCSNTQSFHQTKQLHAFAILNGLLPYDISLCASLILRYATFGAPSISQHLFEETVGHCRTAFLWNTLIRAYSNAGAHNSFVFQTYNRLVRSGIRPDDHSFLFVLKICSDLLEFKKGLEVHGFVFKMGFDSNVYVGNTLMSFYGSYKEFMDARKVFKEMDEKDVVSWNTIIGVLSVNGFHMEALELYKDMNWDIEFMPNFVTVITVLPICAELADGLTARQIHCYVLKVGLDRQVTVGNALIHVYGKCGNVDASRSVFDGMVYRNEVSWNAAICSLAYIGAYMGALNIFKSMLSSLVNPNSITISSIIPVLVELRFFKVAKEVHGFSIRIGIESDAFVANSIIDMYAKAGNSTEASNVFHQMPEKDIVSWNAMIANFAQNRLELASIELVRKMQAQGKAPNTITITNVLPACARLGLLHTGKEIHARSIRMQSTFDLFVSNAIMDMYAKCGCISLAQNVFNIYGRSTVSYNILIVGYSHTSDCLQSLIMFSEMRLVGMTHDVISFVGVISACANLGDIKRGKEIHGLAMRKLFSTHLFVANALLDLYTKRGKMSLAHKVFDRIPNKDVCSWNTMILGYGILGEFETAIHRFEAMKEDRVEYDSVSYIAVLSACSHGGLVEKGKKYFEEMQAQNFEPTQMHYSCMVDLLGRSGLLDEAVELIKGLSIIPDANVWGALLGACRIHGNIELASWAADHLFELKPCHSGYYTILSNMYAEAGRWDEANRIRELMKSRGVKKNPGCSWVQIQDQVHDFVSGEMIRGIDLVGGMQNP